MSLFAFAVKLAQRYREEHEEDKIDNVIHFLSDYVTKHLLDFVETEGGWVSPNLYFNSFANIKIC